MGKSWGTVGAMLKSGHDIVAFALHFGGELFMGTYFTSGNYVLLNLIYYAFAMIPNGVPPVFLLNVLVAPNAWEHSSIIVS